jgi:3-oxoadipate enol-lactonase
MELEERLGSIKCPTLIVTTQESGLQSVEAVKSYAARITGSQLIVLPGDSYHVAAAEPAQCVDELVRFLADISGRPGSDVSAKTVSSANKQG